MLTVELGVVGSWPAMAYSTKLLMPSLSGPVIVRKPFLNLHQTTLDRENRRFGAGFHAELCQDIADMRFNCEFVGC